jgi:hypothetical protein
MEVLVILPVIFFVGFLAFQAGQWSKEYPPEEEMISRLVNARAERHVRKWTAAEVEREIEESALAKAHRS